MTSNYTITFSEFLELYGRTAEWHKIITKISTINDWASIYENEIELNYGLYDALVLRYKNREIGAETPQLFYDNINAKCDAIYTKYHDKLILYNQNIMKTTSRTVDLSLINADYNAYNAINPLNTEISTVMDIRKSDTSYKQERNKEEQMLAIGDNASILKRALEIDNLFDAILKEFESCFLCIY